MDFARFSIPHSSARNDYQKLSISAESSNIIHIDKIDSLPHLNFIPSSFHRLLRLSYPFTDPFVAMSVVPSHYDTIPNTVFQSIQNFLAAAGLLYPDIKTLQQMENTHHYFITYLLREKPEQMSQYDLQNFSFVSELLRPDSDSNILDDIERNYLLLFYTPVGFAYYAPESLDLLTANSKLEIAIIVSRDQLIQLNLSEIRYHICKPCEESVSIQQALPRIFCDFKLTKGIWTPELHFDQIAALMSDINQNSKARLDCRTLNLNVLAGTSYRVIGLIGRYSDIISFFKDDNTDFIPYLKSLQNHLNPFIFFLRPSSSVSYVILYLPSNFMPNHPQYKDVVEYAYTFMRRSCALTLLIPVLKAGSSLNIYSDVQGLLSQANSEEILFFGCGASEIICLSSRIVVESMEFNDIYEFINWLDWISPSYAFDFDKLPEIPTHGQSFDKNTILVLLENSRIAKNNGRNLIDELLYGIYQHLDSQQIVDLLMSIRENNNDISILINEAVNLTSDANFKFKDKYHCKVCCTKEYKQLESEAISELRNNSQLHELCPKCRLEKLQSQTRRDQSNEISCQRLVDSLENQENVYSQHLHQFINKHKKEDNDPQTNPFNYVVNKFITWFFEYWCRYCLNAHWKTLKEGNYLHLDHFDEIPLNESEMINENMPISDVISILTEKKIENNEDLKKNMFDICRICPNILDATKVTHDFRSYLSKIADSIIDEIRVIHNTEQMDRNYGKFKEKCDKVIEELRNKNQLELDKAKSDINNSNTSVISFGKIQANDQMTINVSITNSTTELKFRDYSFNYVNSQKEEKFSARPLQSEKVAVLMQQTCELNLVNSWRVTDGVLSLITMGHKLRLIFLPLNFRGTFVDRYIYEIEIGDPKFCYAEFATRTNTICIVTKIPQGKSIERYFILLKVSLDYTSSTEIRRRPLQSLLPLPTIPHQISINDDNNLVETKDVDIDQYETIFNGFTINDTGSAGIIGATMPATSEFNGAKHYFVQFDPITLSIIKIDHYSLNNPYLDFPITPIFIFQNEIPRKFGQRQKLVIENDEGFNTIVGISHIAKNSYKIVVVYPIFKQKKDQHNVYTISDHGKNIYEVELKGAGDQIKNKIGISYFHNQAMIIISNNNSQPSLFKQIKEVPSFTLMNDMFNANFDFQSIPNFVAGCNKKYGYSEIEKTFFPTHSVYPVELVKFDVVNPFIIENSKDGVEPDYGRIFQPESLMMNEIKIAMSDILPFDFQMPFRIFRKDEAGNESKELNLNSFFLKTDYHYVINFLTRIISLPQTFVHSIPRPPIDSSNFFFSSLETEVFRFMSKFPPLPLLRCTPNRQCITVSLVDVGSGSDGASILSHVTGVPFVTSLPGTVNAGVNFVPVFIDQKPVFESPTEPRTTDNGITPPRKGLTVNAKSVKTFINVIACQFRPDKPDSIQSNAIALYCALGCSDLVIINAGTQTQFLVDVLKYLIDVISPLNETSGQLIELDDEDEEKCNKRIAFVTSLGSNPKSVVEQIQRTLTDTMAITVMNKLQSIFNGQNAFLPSEWSPYQISKSIADQLLLDMYQKGKVVPYRNTIDAYAAFVKASAYFGSLLEHVDFIMESGTPEVDDPTVIYASDN